MTRNVDWDKPSDEDKAYLLARANQADLRRAGLLDEPTYDLTSTPGSMQQYEIDGTEAPVFEIADPEAEAAVAKLTSKKSTAKD